MTLSAINNKREVLCHQSIQPKYSAFLAAECSAIPNTCFFYPRKLFCSAGTLLTNPKLFAHVFLFSIPRQQFGKSWMNTKVMKWRFMHRANIWQGQFSSCSFLLPAENSAWVPNMWSLLFTCWMWENIQRRLILKENWSFSWGEPNFLIFGGLLLAHAKKHADILQSIPQLAFLAPNMQR